MEEFHPDDRLHLGGSIHVELPAHVRNAVEASTHVKGYTPSYGEAPLREAIATTLGNQGIAGGPDRILVTNGAMHALDLVFRAVLRPGDEVLMPSPGFFINGLVRMAGARLVQFPSLFEDGFRPAWSSARGYITPRTRILYVNTPVNPTGYVYDDDDNAAIVELARDAGLLLVSDESLSHFVYGGRRHVSPVVMAQDAVQSVVIRSFSKDFAMPGMRIGYASIPESLFRPVAAASEWSVLCVSRTSQAAALAAMTGPRGWIDQMIVEAGSRARQSSFMHSMASPSWNVFHLREASTSSLGTTAMPSDWRMSWWSGMASLSRRAPPSGSQGTFACNLAAALEDLDRAVSHIRAAVT